MFNTTTVRKFENGAELLAHLTQTDDGTYFQGYHRNVGQRQWICLIDRHEAISTGDLVDQFINRGYIIID